MSDISQPAILRVVEAAARRGVSLDITVLEEPPRSDQEAARLFGVSPDQIVRSLVFVATRYGGRMVPIVCLVSDGDDVDPVRLAAVAGEAALRRATPSETRDLTGFPTDGLPPVGHGHDVRVVMDQRVGRHAVVWATAGSASAYFPVPPGTLRAIANAFVAPVAEPSRTQSGVTEGLLRLETGGSAA